MAGAVAVFVWPALMVRLSAPSPSYPWLTAAFAVALALCVALWPLSLTAGPRPSQPYLGRAAVVGVATGAVLAFAMVTWIKAALALPYSADMLIVIREATRRFLDGGNPYATYRAYDAPWDVVLPYGPLLWGPYLAPQALRTDFRIVTIIGELAVPIVGAAVAAVEALRGRLLSSIAWIGLLVTLVASIQLTAFTLMGHTAAYWPLFPLFAWLVTMRRWRAAALALGVLVVARTTMIAMVPVLLIAIWQQERALFTRAIWLLVLPGLVLFAPFALWDFSTLWGNMVTSYPRIVKAVVWPAPATGVINTIGVTGWLVSHHLERWVELTQGLTMLGAYTAAWRALNKGAAPLPWMAVALTVFSMTALWPLFYLYFDVLLLLTSAAAMEVLRERFSAIRWALGFGATSLAVLLASIVLTERFPIFSFDPPTLRQAFALPRRSRDAAMIEVDLELPTQSSAGTTMAAMLNGRTLSTSSVFPGRNTLRLPAPSATWWRGFNRLDLSLAPSPPSAATISRIAVVPPSR